MPKGHMVRGRTGPKHGTLGREDYEREEMDRLLRQFRPDPDEVLLIRRAAKNWGAPRPLAPCDILGMDCRPGLMSICALVAQGVPIPRSYLLKSRARSR